MSKLQDSEGATTRSRQEQEEELILAAWRSMVRTWGKKSYYPYDCALLNLQFHQVLFIRNT